MTTYTKRTRARIEKILDLEYSIKITDGVKSDFVVFETELKELEQLKEALTRDPDDTTECPEDDVKRVRLVSGQAKLMERLNVYWTTPCGRGAQWKSNFARNEEQAGSRAFMNRDLLLAGHLFDVSFASMVERCCALAH